MSESLDPELARALQEPARLVRADPALLDLVRDAGSPAQSELLKQSSDATTPGDRYAAAAMLAALFHDRGPLDQAARGYGGAPPRELVALTEVHALRPALRESLSSPILTGLLEWATKPDPAAPPLELAMAARDLELSDSSVLRSVASRADQVAQQSARRGQQGPLNRFSEVLRQAADADATTPGSASAPSRPTSQEPAQDPTQDSTPERTREPAQPFPSTSEPEVTTTGIPASEMLSEDEKRNPDPYGKDYPGTGVPVRDSISGHRPDAPAQPSDPTRAPSDTPGSSTDQGPKDGKGKIFDAERFWPMGPRSTDGPGAPLGGSDVARGDRGAHGDRWDTADTGAPAGPPPPPREPSTSELYYGVGSDRYANRDSDSEETRTEERNVVRNWAITFGVIVLILLILVLLL